MLKKRMTCLLVALTVSISSSSRASSPHEQEPPPATAQSKSGESAAHDHRLFECNDNDLASKEFGCELLGKKQLAKPLTEPLFWHLTRFPTRTSAEAALGPNDIVAIVENQIWHFGFGSKDAAPRHGEAIAHIGPLPMVPANAYEIEAFRVVMPPGMHTQVHRHPGPEAWYVLDGEQCLETPAGVQKAHSGESMFAPPNIAMQLTNNGSVVRRAFFIIIHDAAQPNGYPVSTWKPTGACDR